MKYKALTVLLALSALAIPLSPRSAQAEVEVSFSFFQNALDPYGEWVEVGSYGTCWHPTGVADDWSPYSDGYWAYTDAGWTWVSYEDWGGITYHYGRWVRVLGVGWVWVPDYEWGPAWVSWRSNNDYVGWAPLPPEAYWDNDIGFSTWVDSSYDIGPGYYNFCHTYDFGCPVLAPVLCSPYDCVSIFQQTVNITNICYDHGRHGVFCGGPRYDDINRHCRRPIPALKLVHDDRWANRGGRVPPQILRGNQLEVFAPKVTRPADPKVLPVKPHRSVGADQVNRGWSQIKEAAVRNKIKEQLRKETNGLTPQTAPARPVRAEDISAVPKVADPQAPSPGAIVKRRSERPSQNVAAKREVLPRSDQPVQPGRPRALENRSTGRSPELPRVGQNNGGDTAEPNPAPAQTSPPAVTARPERNRDVDVAPRPVRNREVEVAPNVERPARQEQRDVSRPPVVVHPPAERPVEPHRAERPERPAPVQNPQPVIRNQPEPPAARSRPEPPPSRPEPRPEPQARPVQPAPSAPSRPVEKEGRKSKSQAFEERVRDTQRVFDIARQNQIQQRQFDAARQQQAAPRWNEMRQYQARRQEPAVIQRSMQREFSAPVQRRVESAPPQRQFTPQSRQFTPQSRPVYQAPTVQRSGGDRGNGGRQKENSGDGSKSKRQ